MNVRKGGRADVPFVLDLGKRTIESSVSAERDWTRERTGENYDRLIEYALGQSHELLVAQEGADRLGFVLYLDELPDEVTGSPQAFVVYAAVEPHARRKGVGRALFTAFEESARGRGLPYVSLMVTEQNVAARELYAQLGYVTERRQLCKRL
ncbi:MAG: GNAT family N-acetyltransferase [Candidatus Eremiobacteraeota bacterium]|nr:GNAT family N-acetyltransferase [Candidatus Eremiobacteraeota bacterium]